MAENLSKNMRYTIYMFCFLYFMNGKLNAQVMYGKVDYRKPLNFHNNYFKFSQPFEFVILGKKHTSCPTPISINGEEIYAYEDANIDREPVFINKAGFSQYIFSSIKTALEKLPDGKYRIEIFNLVVDRDGQLVYFDFDTLKPSSGEYETYVVKTSTNNNWDEQKLALQGILNVLEPHKKSMSKNLLFAVSKEDKMRIYHSLYTSLKKCPKFRPALKDGKPVNFLLNPTKYGFTDIYTVKNHQASIQRIRFK